METTTISVDSLFSREIQFIIPLFQRHYVWDKEDQWKPLWEDIEEKVRQRVSEQYQGQHFTGAIVIQQRNAHVNEVRKFEIIDGQQRLTTFQIILCALRDVCEEYKFDDILGTIERYICNQEYTSNGEQYKLVPTEYDREPFMSLVDKDFNNCSGKIRSAYTYFKNEIIYYVDSDKKKIRTLFRSMLEDFAFVQIRLDLHDHPERIFESLNARRKQLLDFDLLRNNLFLKARIEEDRDNLYKDYWKHFEEEYWHRDVTIGREKRVFSEVFFQHFLMAKLGSENVNPLFIVYLRERGNIANKGIKHELSELKRYSETYQVMTDCPQDTEIGQAMSFYKALEITSLHPFILFIVNELKVSGPDISSVLRVLESYTMRRLVCTKQGIKNYNKYFSGLIGKLRGKPFDLDTFVKLLSDEKSDTTKWPTDDDVDKYLRIGEWEDYKISSKYICYILYRIELMKRKDNRFLETDRLDFDKKLTLEHIMPKKWATTWCLPLLERNEEGELKYEEKTIMYKELFSNEYKENNQNWDSAYDPRPLKEGLIDKSLEDTLVWATQRNLYIDSIGNLTLVTGRLNSSLSNDTFPNKKDRLFQNSLLILNKEVCGHGTWNTLKIQDRATEMFTLFCKIWPSLEHFREGVA